MSPPTPRLLLAVTAPQSLLLLRGQLAAARAAGFEVFVLSAPGDTASRVAHDEGAYHIEIAMARELRLGRDLAALLKIVRALRAIRPDIVNAGTPKAGLLVGLGAWLTRVPVRIHTLRGLRFETQRGLQRALVRMATRVTCSTAQRVICVSPSLLEQAIATGVALRETSIVLGNGSSNGVDVDHFSMSPELESAGARLRQRFGIEKSALVIGFVGRLARDKGVSQLSESWSQVRAFRSDVHLFLAGGLDASDPVPPSILSALHDDPRVHSLGELKDVRTAYAAMDVVVLPSLREGFPNVLLEAAAMGRPVVAYDVTGSRDAVVHDHTGLLVPARSATALEDALFRYLNDPELRVRHGRAAAERARTYFRRELIWNELHTLYRSMLHSSP